MDRRPLRDAFSSAEKAELQDSWEKTEAVKLWEPIPYGDYVARLLRHELFKSKSGTPGVRLVFEIREGEYAGRTVSWVGWLTEKAMPYLKGSLENIGITEFALLEKPTPQGIVCSIRVVTRTDDTGVQWNEVKKYEYLGREKPDPFTPDTESPSDPVVAEGDGQGQTENPGFPPPAEEEKGPKPEAVNLQEEDALWI